jgi:hypothetical protein
LQPEPGQHLLQTAEHGTSTSVPPSLLLHLALAAATPLQTSWASLAARDEATPTTDSSEAWASGQRVQRQETSESTLPVALSESQSKR